MSQSDVFRKKHEETMARDQKAILEEMNLPPAVVDFVRKNSKNLKILIAVLVVGLISWEGYGKYTSVQREKSSAMLYDAVSAEDTAAQLEQLKKLTDQYSGTGSGAWAQVELGHLAVKDAKYQEASDYYSAALNSLSKNNPMYPLVQFSLAQAYENLADSGKASQAYQQLIDMPGFATLGYLGLGRIAESEGKPKQALDYYQEYLNLPSVESGPTKDWVDSKISVLKGAK